MRPIVLFRNISTKFIKCDYCDRETRIRYLCIVNKSRKKYLCKKCTETNNG